MMSWQWLSNGFQIIACIIAGYWIGGFLPHQHKWEKWKQCSNAQGYLYQSRVCKYCNKMETENISMGTLFYSDHINRLGKNL